MNRVPANGSGAAGGDMSSFYTEIGAIQDSIAVYNDNVRRISELQARSLNNINETVAQKTNEQIENLTNENRTLSDQIKRRIKNLASQRVTGPNAQVRKTQIDLVRQKFVEAIQSYQEVERQNRTKYKQRLERQFKIVKPNASPEEVKAVVNDDQGGQVFTQALMNSNRIGESRAAYREVQERHEDIKRIEKTLTELAQLFNDMSILIDQQGETLDTVEQTVQNVDRDIETGYHETERAVVSARAARRKRWICFIIILIILAVIAIIVAVVITNQKKNN